MRCQNQFRHWNITLMSKLQAVSQTIDLGVCATKVVTALRLKHAQSQIVTKLAFRVLTFPNGHVGTAGQVVGGVD